MDCLKHREPLVLYTERTWTSWPSVVIFTSDPVQLYCFESTVAFARWKHHFRSALFVGGVGEFGVSIPSGLVNSPYFNWTHLHGLVKL